MTTKAWRDYKRILKEMTESGEVKGFPRLTFEKYRDEVRFARDVERMHAKRSGDFFVYDKDGEGWTVIYKDPIQHGGTKGELIKYLWDEHATEINSAYDCTGRAFTTHFKVAHLRGDLWKVAEHFSLDV